MITDSSTVKSVNQGTVNARPKWVWHPQCATEVALIRANFGLDRSIRANFGLDCLIRTGFGRAPHPESFCQCPVCSVSPG